MGVSSDSTIFIWDRATGALREVMYHHRASVWGIRIQDNWIVTGSMDGSISVVDIETLKLRKHFVAHENEWGSKYKTYNLQFTNRYLYFCYAHSYSRTLVYVTV